jgi:benzoyl-CoA reductase/2-hydroxyglutaryl-CoA dehydratase subunit BcrC/BadD/HgdB
MDSRSIASISFGPGKCRSCHGLILVMEQKFCDPEEFDFVPLKRIRSRGYSLLQLEVDRQMVNSTDQNAIQTF